MARPPLIRLWVKTNGSHFGVGAPPILVYFNGDWDVHRGYGILNADSPFNGVDNLFASSALLNLVGIFERILCAVTESRWTNEKPPVNIQAY